MVTPFLMFDAKLYFVRWIIVIVGSSSLTVGDIKNGVTIFGVKGTSIGWLKPQ